MNDPVRVWHRIADESVLLDGFHALKHAVRFGADIPVAVTTDRRATLELAANSPPTSARPWTACWPRSRRRRSPTS